MTGNTHREGIHGVKQLQPLLSAHAWSPGGALQSPSPLPQGEVGPQDRLVTNVQKKWGLLCLRRTLWAPAFANAQSDSAA